MTRKLILLMATVVFAIVSTARAQEADSTRPGLALETQFCKAVEERMPVNPADTFSSDVEKVYLWCLVTGAKDSTSLTFVWSRDGEEMASVDLPVKSEYWRTWTSKNIKPEWTGQWEVKILDSEGQILKSAAFTVVPATERPEATETESSPEPEPEPEPDPSDSVEPDV
jgi:hypothetical protein